MFYARSADVTALVTAGGVYATGRVPATQSSDDENNVAGWTLAVLYLCRPSSRASVPSLYSSG